MEYGPGPYRPPGAYDMGHHPALYEMGQPPSVLMWARVYSGAFAFMYLCCTGIGVAMLATPNLWQASHGELPPGVMALIFIGMGLPLTIISVMATFMRRTKGAWILHIVLQALGLTSCMCMPFAIPLLIQWLKPETKRWFSM